MPIEIRLAPHNVREHIERMMSPYLADLGAPPGTSYPRLDAYWHEPGRYPYIIAHGEEIVGFMLVHQVNEDSSCDLVEFYVAARFRNRGVGRQAAAAVFNLHPGKWSVAVRRDNPKGQVFWQSILATYPSLTVVDVSDPEGIMYKFSSQAQ